MIVDDRPTPLVSVIIPVYNAAAYLRETIDSVLAQLYPNIEVLVVDDGSTEDLSRIVAAYGDRVRYVRKPNGGPASARNLGVRMATADYIAFLDADDVWEPEKLRAQIDMLLLHPSLGLVYSTVSEIDRDGRLRSASRGRQQRPSGDIAQALFWHNWIPTSTVVTRRACFAQVGWFDEARELISVEDYDMWLRIAERYQVMYLEQPLVRYRAHAGGISRNIARSYLGEQLVIEKAVARNAQRAPYMSSWLKRRLARVAFNCGHEYFSINEFANARRQFWRALGYRPLHPKGLCFWAATYLEPRQVEAVRRWRRSQPPADRPQRVAHVLFSLDTGGAEHVALDVLRRLSPERYDRHVVSLTGSGQLVEEFQRSGITVHTLHKRPGVDLRLWLALAAFIRRQRFDVVHTHNITPWLYAGPAAVLAGARLVHTEHSNLLPHQRRLMVAERWLARITRWVVADSDDVRRCLIERQGLRARNVVTVRNGIDTGRFAQALEPAQARSRLGLDGAGPVVGTVARLVDIKDHPTLLAAFRQLVEEFPRAVLLMVGDGPLRHALEAQAKTLGIAEQVRFLGRRTDIPEILPALDVFVLSSLSEGLPLTVLEAMAAGVPVVATDVGALREAVQEGRTGLLVPMRSPERLAAAICSLLRDVSRRHAMGLEARRLARASFDLSDMVYGYETAYRH